MSTRGNKTVCCGENAPDKLQGKHRHADANSPATLSPSTFQGASLFKTLRATMNAGL